ncbi:23055_t:CDS:2 [Dentiscutata erythropus]|uniref:23055_t:CDS:1 n=1 Tax=Dentiscutata erythropus TaxID=1348616 RepID=A0A9N9GSS5_9GLOM|nr:23055_t:CDS:2 [Dentiscutata erythropus]
MHSNPVRKNVKKEGKVSSLGIDIVDKIYERYYFMYIRIINSVTVLQWAWRTYKLRPETWASRVWNIVRNDTTPDEKKFLAKDVPAYHQKCRYNNYSSLEWAEKKKDQLKAQLDNVVYIVTFIVLHQQGYRIVYYGSWSYMLKWLSNPEYYHIDKKYWNCDNENFVISSEYTRYMCKIAGKPYPCNSLKIDYFKIGYIDILRKKTSIDFLNLNNNCEYVC